MKTGNVFVAFSGLILCLLLPLFSDSQNITASHYGNEIDRNELRNYLNVLASDSLEGRKTGRAGQKKAADFISGHFSSLGLQPISHGKFIQHHPVSIRSNAGKNLEVHQKFFLFMKDYFCLPYTKDSLIILDTLVFAGYGISDNEYDDYAKINVEGKAILFLDGYPHGKKFNSSSGSFEWNKKMATINRKKPSVVFIVTESIDKVVDSLIYSPEIETPPGQQPAIPILFITPEVAKNFFPENEEAAFDKAIAFIDRKSKPRSFPIATSAFVHLTENINSMMGENVAGYLEGTDKKDEVVVITAHYDHLGIRDSLIYHGADDNGSGTSAVMELARIFSLAKKEGHGPRRSILFMTVSGEENGLLGSSYYVAHPLVPLEKTMVNLNCDMIGRTDEKHDSLGVRNYVYVIGADRLSSQLHKINETANATYTKLELDYQYNNIDDPNRYYSRSDHYNFAKNNIPIIFYFNGTHADYHKPGDTIDKIDFELLAKRAQLIFYTAWELANGDKRIFPDVKKTKKGPEENTEGE